MYTRAVLAALLQVLVAEVAAQREPAMVWPMPMSMRQGEGFADLASSFKITTSSDSDTLRAAIERYTAIMFASGKPGSSSNTTAATAPALASLEVTVTDPSEDLGLETCENYTLSVKGGLLMEKASLNACTIYGAMHGLETFAQLVRVTDGGYAVPSIEIDDGPRFHFRGLLIDSSRHFLPMPVLKATVDALAYNKMNVLHWHIVDGDSFPFESKTFPGLTAKGAYSENHIYTHEAIQDLVEYAHARGVRVMPEFDTPGHVFPSWCNGATGPDAIAGSESDGAYPQVCTACSKQHVGDSGWGPLRADLNTTYDFLEQLFKEIADVFPEKYLHLGGDEVSFECWNENSEVAAFMRSKGYSGADLENYYEGRLLDIVGGPSVNKSYMVWQEIFNNGVKAKMDTVIDVWKGFDKQTMAEATKAGYKVCLSGGWYLDALKTTPGKFDGWDFYLQEPTDFEGSDAQKKLVMGGKAAMWGEHVDATNLLSRVWPRTSCVAERLWSPESVKDEEAAKPRLHKFRCDLLARGIPAEPISPGGSIPGVPVQAQNAPG